MPDSIVIAASGERLAGSVEWARSRKARRRGLLARPPLEPGEALILDKAWQVHTFGMKYSIDVVFCSKDGTVRHVVRSMPPRRVTRFVLGARYAIELPAGTVDSSPVVGDRILIQPQRSSER